MTFVPSREGPFYQGTSLTLPCTVTLDRSLVDTDVAVDFTFTSAPVNTTGSDVVQLNSSTFIATAVFGILKDQDSFLCTTLFRPLPSTPFIKDSGGTSVDYVLRADGKP